MDKSLLGHWSKPVRNVIEQGAVRKFADAIDDLNPLYRDEAYAKQTRFGRLIAPPTFPMTLDFGVIPGVLVNQEGMIHGEQTFHFERPLFVGECLLCSTRLRDVSVRSSAGVKMTFLVYDQKGETADGELVFTARMNVIQREAVAQ